MITDVEVANSWLALEDFIKELEEVVSSMLVVDMEVSA